MRTCRSVHAIPRLRHILQATMIAAAAVITITACAAHGPDQANTSLLGSTKEQIVACAGTPLEETQDQDLTILAYYKEASILEEAFPQSKGSFPKVHHGCRARIGLKDNHVVGVEYQSIPESYEDANHCEEIFEPCQSSGRAAAR